MSRRSLWSRTAKFAFVGAMGILIQLGTLYLLNSFAWNYVVSTGAAVEAALLHNFVWHEKFTWSDRRLANVNGWPLRMLRFHLSNGAISMVGNILLMWAFVGGLAIPVVFANLLSIAICCLANFIAGDRWVFAEISHHEREGTVFVRSAIKSNAR
ncbi:MAG: GtrA family protein [Terriglobales bacterium]